MGAADDELLLLGLIDELLLKVINMQTTTEASGLLTACRRLSALTRPNVPQKRQREARRFRFVSRLLDGDSDELCIRCPAGCGARGVCP